MTQMKPDLNTAHSSTAPPVCSNCRVEERRLLLLVRQRSVFLRLCTTCVLRLHPHNFCPTCFQVYPPPPLPNDAVRSCSKCYSVTHLHCAESAGAPTFPSNSYICPLCLHPDKPIFKLKPANIDIIGGGDDNYAAMDRDATKKLLAAVKIAWVTMNSGAAAAKVEAEKRAKDAAAAKKRARESLEHVARLAVKEKMRKKEDALAGPTLGGGSGVGVKMERGYNVNVGSNNRSGIATSLIVNKADNSNRVLAALNAVELRENEEMGNGDQNVGDLDEERNDDSGCDDHLNFVDMESGDIEEENVEVLVQQPVVVDDRQMENKEKQNGVEENGNDATL